MNTLFVNYDMFSKKVEVKVIDNDSIVSEYAFSSDLKSLADGIVAVATNLNINDIKVTGIIPEYESELRTYICQEKYSNNFKIEVI